MGEPPHAALAERDHGRAVGRDAWLRLGLGSGLGVGVGLGVGLRLGFGLGFGFGVGLGLPRVVTVAAHWEAQAW